MAVFNAAKREIDLKIVYYGPAMCGKTTNVQCIHKMLAPQQRGELMSLATKDDRTLFFDFLPIELGDVRGFKTRFHIYTVPGQVYYALTRRAVLTGADGVVFVVDSQTNKLQDNIESLKDLAENLRFYKKDLTSFPFVLQYNKRDLPNVMPADELNTMLNTLNVPAFESSAVTGMGVVETLTAICKIVLKQMDSGTAKKKPAAPGARPGARPAMAPSDADLRIFSTQQRAAAPPPPPPPKPAERVPSPPRPTQGVPSFTRQPEAPPLKPKPEAPPPTMPPAFSDINPLQAKAPSGFAPGLKGGATPGFSFTGESKKPAADEDASGLVFEENEPDLSFDDADSGLDIEEPAAGLPDTDIELPEPEAPEADEPDIELAEEEMPDIEISTPGLPDIESDDLEMPDIELPEPELPGTSFSEPGPELSFDDEPGITIEEPTVALDELAAAEEDASALVLDDEVDILEEPAPAPAPPQPKIEKPPFTFEAPPPFDAPPLVTPPTAGRGQPGIISCGEPQKISATEVKLPLTLRLKDNSECPVTVTISIDLGLGKK